MRVSEQKSIRDWVSPSNVAVVTLVGFLSVGYVTDWRMLRGGPSKSAAALSPGLPKHALDSAKSRLRYVPSEKGGMVYVPVDPRSEVADSRAASHDEKRLPELD